jgi:hypothetical protein
MHIFVLKCQIGYILLVYWNRIVGGIVTLMDEVELALGFHAANNLVGA